MTEGKTSTSRERADALATLAVSDSVQRSDCVSLETLAAWHEELLSNDDHEQIAGHVAGCDTCYRTWVNLLELEEARATQTKTAARRHNWFALPRLASVGLAAAVLVGLFIALQGGPPDTGLEPLPHYDLYIRGSATLRGPLAPGVIGKDAGRVHVDEGNLFELRLIPETASEAPVQANIFVERDGRLDPWQAPPARVLDNGVVILESRVGTEFELLTGKFDLLVVVGYAAHLPAATDLQLRLEGRQSAVHEYWSAWRISLQTPADADED